MAEFRMTIKPEKVTVGNSFTVTIYDDPKFRHELDFQIGGVVTIESFPAGAPEQTKTVRISLDKIGAFPPDSKEISVNFRATRKEEPSALISDKKMITLEGCPQARPKVEVKDEPVSNLPSQFAGAYIRSKSKMKITIKATPAAGATITRTEVKVGNGKWEGVDGGVYQTDELGVAGRRQYVVRCTDSRGLSAEIVNYIEVVPYETPLVFPGPTGKLEAYRCLPDGTANPAGTSIRILAGRIYSKVKINGAQKNFCLLRYRIKKDGQEYPAWSDLVPADSLDSNMADKIISNAAADIKSRYTVQIGVVDTIGEERATTIKLPADLTPLHLGEGGKNVGIGQYCNYAHQYAVDIGWQVYFNRGLALRTVFTTEFGNSVMWEQGQKLKSVYPDADLSMVYNTYVFITVIRIASARHVYVPVIHVPGSASAGASNVSHLQGFGAAPDGKVLKQFPIEFQIVETNGEDDLLFQPITIDGMQDVEIAGLFALI